MSGRHAAWFHASPGARALRDRQARGVCALAAARPREPCEAKTTVHFSNEPEAEAGIVSTELGSGTAAVAPQDHGRTGLSPLTGNLQLHLPPHCSLKWTSRSAGRTVPTVCMVCRGAAGARTADLLFTRHGPTVPRQIHREFEERHMQGGGIRERTWNPAPGH
ncbi:hypothetical protein NDU88_004336 [Pleurodeles waltl]|uniref:Uncharacterized protein n=1 Tax=Pleurodeles waltl TaxID=8319 RepID=A0AAV7V4W2_PLEWA|nr:hypothetical protein NDU88_004336 [Pleurodeles waltl]